MTHDLLAHLPASEQLTPMMSSAAGVLSFDASDQAAALYMDAQYDGALIV